MVNLKYSVGTTNKFSGLHIGDDSSEEEEETHGSVRPRENQEKPSPVQQEVIHHPIESKPTVSSSEGNRPNKRESVYTGKGGTTADIEAASPRGKNPGRGNHAPTNRNSDEQAEGVNGTREKPRGQRFNRTREHDRRSNTARSDGIKKDGGGRHNWGHEGSWSIEGKNASSESLVESRSDKKLVPEDTNDVDTPNEAPNQENELNEVVEKKEESVVMMDLDAWKAQQAAKRLNLPPVANKPIENNVNSIKELEAQGYTRYVKERSEARVEDHKDALLQEGLGDDMDNRRKKTLNVYEYLYHGKNNVELFAGYRGRGRRGGSRSGRVDRFEKTKSLDFKERDAPDLQDFRAFPALGDAKIVS